MACAVGVCAGAAAAQDVDVSSGTRLESVMALIRARDPKAAPDLAARFDAEPQPGIRGWIVRAVGRLDAKGGEALFESGLRDPNPEVRIAAAEALGKKGGARALADLTAALGAETNAGVRASIAFWLGSFKDAASAAVLGQALAADPDPNVRVQAAQSLKRHGTRRATSELQKGVKDLDERVRNVTQTR